MAGNDFEGEFAPKTFAGEFERAAIAPEASIWSTEPRDVDATGAKAKFEAVGVEVVGATPAEIAGATGAAIAVGAAGFSTLGGTEAKGAGAVRAAASFAAKAGEMPGGLASERGDREPDNSRAPEDKVQNETLRFKRDALAGAKRCVQLGADAFFAVRRGLGAEFCTMKSPLGFEGAASIFEVTCEKTAPELQKRLWLESRS